MNPLPLTSLRPLSQTRCTSMSDTHYHLSWARHQLGIRVRAHFQNSETFGGRISKIRSLGISIFKKPTVFSAAQRGRDYYLYSRCDVPKQFLLFRPPQPGGVGPELQPWRPLLRVVQTVHCTGTQPRPEIWSSP